VSRFSGDHLHVLALGLGVDRDELLAGARAPQLVQDARFRRDEEPVVRRGFGLAHHPAGRQDLRAVGGQLALAEEPHHVGRAPALEVDGQLGVGRLVLPALDVGGTDTGVDVAFAQPDGQLSPGDPLEPDPEEHVREKQDLAVGGNRLDNRFRVA
jgi:hypothetical protein